MTVEFHYSEILSLCFACILLGLGIIQHLAIILSGMFFILTGLSLKLRAIPEADILGKERTQE